MTSTQTPITDVPIIDTPVNAPVDLLPLSGGSQAREQPSARPAVDIRWILMALYTIAAGAVLGVLSMVLFYRFKTGVNAPLFFGVGSVALILGARHFRSVPKPINYALIIPVPLIAVTMFIWENSSLAEINWIAILAIGTLTCFYLPSQRRFVDDGVEQFSIGSGFVALASAALPLVSLNTAFRGLIAFLSGGGKWREPVFAVLRGLLIAAPIVLVFTILLASADQVFNNLLSSLARLFNFSLSADLYYQIFGAFVVGWLVTGVLSYVLVMRPETAAPEKPKRYKLIGPIEAITVLISIVTLFAVFVGVQFTYFFGGERNIGNLTYAEYARRGFFELVALSVLTLGLLLVLSATSVRPTRGLRRAFRIAATVLVGLTGVLLVSAAGRMALYEQAYGYTHLRIATHVFMGWLGVLFAIYLVILYRSTDDMRGFAAGTLIVAVGYLFMLNVINMDAVIARENLRRFENGADLDFTYLGTLSADATPEIIRFWERTTDALAKEDAGHWLARTNNRLSVASNQGFGTNISRSFAYSNIQPLLSSLPTYDARYVYNYSQRTINEYR